MVSQKNTKKVLVDIIKKLIFTGLFSLALGTVGFFAALHYFPSFIEGIPEAVDWSLLEGFSSLLSLSLFVGGGTFAISEYIKSQLVEEREKNKLSYEIYQAIFAKVTEPEQESARRWILQNIVVKKDSEDLAEWFDRENKKVIPPNGSDEMTEGQKAIKLTLNAFDHIGYIADHFWVMDEDALAWISVPVAKVWERLGPYVERVQELRGVDDYYLSAQSIGKRCVAWREAKGLKKENIARNTP